MIEKPKRYTRLSEDLNTEDLNKSLGMLFNWAFAATDALNTTDKRLDTFGYWMDKHREMHVKDIDKLLDELESQHLDRRIIELDDVMRNNFTWRLDELEERFKECEEAWRKKDRGLCSIQVLVL